MPIVPFVQSREASVCALHLYTVQWVLICPSYMSSVSSKHVSEFAVKHKSTYRIFGHILALIHCVYSVACSKQLHVYIYIIVQYNV